MNFDDGMDWLDDAETDADAFDQEAAALDTVASSARLSLFNLVRRTYDEISEKEGVTRSGLAEKIRLKPSQVGRLLRSPTNMTVGTAAKLLYVMGKELRFDCRSGQSNAVAMSSSASQQTICRVTRGGMGGAFRTTLGGITVGTPALDRITCMGNAWPCGQAGLSGSSITKQELVFETIN